MDAELANVVSNLESAVEIILSPDATPTDRAKAHQICDEFKDNSPHCIECGLILARQGYPHIIRHFGLQLLEHSIKFKWNSLREEEKTHLKSCALLLIQEGTAPILEEQVHIKDAVSKIVVELMKHEWPNLWPTLLADLHKLCLEGPTQTELVLKVFLRLVEDIVIFQNLNHQRRREIMTAITGNIANIFELFVSLLQQHTTSAETLVQSKETDDKLHVLYRSHLKVSEAALMTLSGYLDWVNMSHILIKDNLLLQMLCLLLSNSDLQLIAAECLLIIVSRKGKIEERQPLLLLFHEGAMSTIWNAAVEAEKASKDEHFYLFLKRLCQILVEMGKQLCVMWNTRLVAIYTALRHLNRFHGSELLPDVKQPPNFNKYLEALLAFTQHPSQMLSSLTQNLWASFLRHEFIAKDEIFVTFIPRIMETATKTLLKVGFPSQSNSPSCDYARLDFDNDEEFNLFFTKYRAETSETLRQATLICPQLAFNYASQCLKVILDKPVDSGEEAKSSNCNLSSPSFLEWDALTVFLESVMGKINLSDQSEIEKEHGISLLKSVLNYHTQDPLILSCLLSCISALFIYLKHTPETLPTVLQKIFSAVVFNLPGQTKSTRSKAVKNVRQHACSSLVKICKQYKELVFPVFDQLYNHIQEIGKDPDQLSQMEKCILVESTILISNEFKNFEKQTAFLAEVMKPVKDLWLSEEFNQAFWATDKLMTYIGLNQAPVEPSSADTCGINRSHITYCIHMMLAVMKRSKWPDDQEKAKEGGFVIGKKDNGDYIMRNPATSHVSVLLENNLALVKAMNMLWCKQYLARRHPEFIKSYDLPDSEKQVLLGIPPPCVDNTSSPMCKKPLERMQNFLTSSHDISYHILGNAGQCLGSEFYTIPSLAMSLVHTALSHLDVIPDYRLRPIIRVFLKSYVHHCPSQYYTTALLPLLESICPYMYQRLSTKWEIINQKCQTRTETGEEENPESQEVLEEQLTRQVTRDYIDLLRSICLTKRSDVSEEEMQDESDEKVVQQSQNTDLGELGVCCMHLQVICESLVLCVFTGLSWNDTTVCSRSLGLCYPLLKQLLADNNLSSEGAVHLYKAIMSSLQLHGQHDTSQSMLIGLGLQAYELLSPIFPEIKSLMLQIPSCRENHLKNLDDMLVLGNGPQKVGERKKKDAYKKLVVDIIGKNISQQFRRDIHYQSLPNLFRKIKPKQPSLEERENQEIGLAALFKPEKNEN